MKKAVPNALKSSAYKSNAPIQIPWWRQRIAVGLALIMLLLFSSTAFAAEVLQGDPYILPRGEVVNDDLYVTGSEVIIDGTVEGDLVVAAGFVEINGVVMGDLLAAGGAVVISGVVQDDVRAAGGGVILSGSVGDDFFAAGGGGWPGMGAVPMATMQVQDRNVPQGVQVAAGSTIGGDAYIAGGQGLVAGSIGRDLAAAMGAFTLSGRVAGNANLTAESLTVQPGASVQGELRYSTDSEAAVPEGVAASVVERPRDENEVASTTGSPVSNFFRWLWRTALALVGYLLVGWLLWTFAPRQINDPVAVVEDRPMEAGIMGLLVAVAVLPIAAALTFLGVIFWGWFPGGLIMLAFVLGLAAVVWLLSPVITGLWVGRWLAQATGAVEGELPRLLLGIAAIVLVARVLTVIPCIGDFASLMIYLASFALAVGGWIMTRRRPTSPPAALSAPAAPPVPSA